MGLSSAEEALRREELTETREEEMTREVLEEEPATWSEHPADLPDGRRVVTDVVEDVQLVSEVKRPRRKRQGGRISLVEGDSGRESRMASEIPAGPFNLVGVIVHPDDPRQ